MTGCTAAQERPKGVLADIGEERPSPVPGEARPA
jgi:hypothetical protein